MVYQQHHFGAEYGDLGILPMQHLCGMAKLSLETLFNAWTYSH
jgi:hypothetical protein